MKFPGFVYIAEELKKSYGNSVYQLLGSVMFHSGPRQTYHTIFIMYTPRKMKWDFFVCFQSNDCVFCHIRTQQLEMKNDGFISYGLFWICIKK